MCLGLLRAGVVSLGVMVVLAPVPNSVALAQSSGPQPWGPRAFCTDGGGYKSGTGGPNCVYYTWEQCIASARGTGETCMTNPYYAGEPKAPGAARKHRRRS